MNKIYSLIALSLLYSSCTQPKQPQQTQKILNLDSIKQVLKQTDQAFSDLSKRKGQQAAFLEYMDGNVTMLRPNSMPLVSKDTMRKVYAQRSDTSFTLTWSPLFADVSASGDLGYTYGTWLFETKSGEKQEGTYCTIWKQDASGNWKFVLDTGNDGLKKPEEKK